MQSASRLDHEAISQQGQEIGGGGGGASAGSNGPYRAAVKRLVQGFARLMQAREGDLIKKVTPVLLQCV